MPHITLELSDNLPLSDVHFPKFFAELHQVLVSNLGVALLNCKSRLVRHKNFYVADGNNAHAFAHLEIKILEGRSTAEIIGMGNIVLELLIRTFETSHKELIFQPSVEVIGIEPANYFKLTAEKIMGR
jgi:5-carboxymethyl-2-hydroxymuconate isomerase